MGRAPGVMGPNEMTAGSESDRIHGIARAEFACAHMVAAAAESPITSCVAVLTTADFSCADVIPGSLP